MFGEPALSDGLSYLPVEMGMLGMSIEDIPAGKKGFVKLPIGVRDPTMAGGRKWVKVKVTAMEDVRAFRDVIVGNDQGEIKEHTPVELSYEKIEGGYQRVGENHPLPVTMGKGLVWTHLLATAANNTLIVTPATGKYIRVHFISYGNRHNTLTVVGLLFEGGTAMHILPMAANGGSTAMNLTDACWDGEIDQPLYAWLNAAYASGIDFNIGYTEEG
jgi:hypothetical protein